MTGASFLAARRALIEADELTPARRRRALSDLADAWLARLLTRVGGGPQVALVAVGGYGRQELLPGSDLDVLLLHGQGDAAAVAESLFYPIWDAGVPLDHAVRTLPEARETARHDLKATLGLLDARHIAGAAELTETLRSTVRSDWRRDARRRLPELSALSRERAARVGELAHLLEPDLVEASGGLRDVLVLRAVAASWIADRPHDIAVEEAREWLLVVRDTLHRMAGHRSTRHRRDRLHLAEQDAVAERLGLADADVLLRRVSQAGRVIAYATDVTLREVDRAVRVRPARRRVVPPTLADGVVEYEGEAVLSALARPNRDAVLALRAAAAAARAGLPLAAHTVRRLATECPPLPDPWPDEARHHLVSLLASGRGLVRVWDALDAVGLVSRWLPDWERVRFRPQRTPVHRHTVDRHLVETVVQAAALTRRVSRPDLLLLGALFHDLGKGGPGDHSDAGVPIAAALGRRLGLPPRDVATLQMLVRHHLLLPESATRRDLDDPDTLRSVAAAVGDADTLDLLAALTEADATAAGPAAWTPWRAALVRDLLGRVRSALRGGPPPGPAPPEGWQRELAERGALAFVVDAATEGTVRITVTAPDQARLLATVAGVLSLQGLDVRRASALTLGGTAVQVWHVVGKRDHRVDAIRIGDEVGRALAGRLDLAQRLASRSKGSVQRHVGLPLPPATAMIVPAASTTATVLQVRTQDEPGLLHRLTSAVAAAGVFVRSAVAETLGLEAVDVLYLVDSAGRPLGDDMAGAVLSAVRCTLACDRGTLDGVR